MGRVVFGSLFFSLILACSSSTTSGDASPAVDAGSSTAAARCTIVAPRLGDGAEAQALAATPARCGQPAHTWLADAKLGEVTGTNAHETYVASALGLLATAGGITPPGPLSDVTVDQIAYVTQDRGALLDATAIVAFPTGRDPSESLGVLLVLHGTSGFTDQCAPSSALEARQLAATLASAGYVVVAPDYIGMRAFGAPTGFLHPYLVGQATAIASLDAVRAAARHVAKQEGASCASTRFATIGGSQGGHAALWVDRLAPYYAPELDHAGVVATVPPADMVAETTRALTQIVPASANVAAFLGAASGWYGASAKLGEAFAAPLDTKLPAAMAASCDPSDGIKDAKALSDVYAKGLLDGVAGGAIPEPWGCMVRENSVVDTSVARLVPKTDSYGILFVVGEKDALVDTATERKGFDKLCAQGMPLQLLECAGASHTQTTRWALPEIFDFARDRLAGKAMDPTAMCAVKPAVTCRATN